MRESFILYTEYDEQISLLDTMQKGILLDAIMAYTTDRELPTMDGIVKMCFSFIRSRLDRDAQKYEEKCEKRKEAGKNAASARWKKESSECDSMRTDANACERIQDTQPECDSMRFIHDNEYEYDPDNDNENDKLSVSDETDCGTSPTDTAQVIEAWNSLGITPIRSIRPDTERGIWFKKRVRDYGIENILEAIENVRRSDFLMGKTDRPFNLTFDWFIRPNNFIKVLEGNYSNKGRDAPKTSEQKKLDDFYTMANEWAEDAG